MFEKIQIRRRKGSYLWMRRPTRVGLPLILQFGGYDKVTVFLHFLFSMLGIGKAALTFALLWLILH